MADQTEQTDQTPRAVPDSVTICITSCGRLDLLEKTLETFQRYNTGGKYIVSEDSADDGVIAAVKARMPYAQVLTGEGRTGLMTSIDRLYSAVETPYLFHLEDDWAFDGPVDWEGALAAFDANPKITNVTVRAFDEIKGKYRRRSTPETYAGRDFAHISPKAHPEWFGWSPNPGLFRTEIYHRYKPFNRVTPDRMSAIIKEIGTQAFLLPGVARHIGHGRNVSDPGTAPRPKSKIGKYIRFWKYQLYYAGILKSPF